MDLPGERILLSSCKPLNYEALGSENPQTSGGSDVSAGRKSPGLLASSFALMPATGKQASSSSEAPKRTPLSPVVANGSVQQSKGAAPTAPLHQPVAAAALTAQANPFGRSAFRSTLFGFKVRQSPQPTDDKTIDMIVSPCFRSLGDRSGSCCGSARRCSTRRRGARCRCAHRRGLAALVAGAARYAAHGRRRRRVQEHVPSPGAGRRTRPR